MHVWRGITTLKTHAFPDCEDAQGDDVRAVVEVVVPAGGLALATVGAVGVDAAEAAGRLSPRGRVRPAGDVIRRDVDPSRPIRIAIPRVGWLTGPAGAVSRRGVIVVRPYRASLAGGVRAAGLGVDVALRGTTLKRPLTLTQRLRGRWRRGAVPLVAHRGAGGRWDLRPGRVVGRRYIRLTTTRFSFNIPAWANPAEWVRAIGRWIARHIGGRTSPISCGGAPSWISVRNDTSTAHVCVTSNDDARGERAEVRIKSNRGAVLQVTLAGARDYAWVNGQPDRLRALIGKLTGTNPDETVFLSPGDEGVMTVGYRQPAGDAEYVLKVEHTYKSMALSLAYYLIDNVVNDVTSVVKYTGAAYLLSKCSGALDLQSGTAKSPKDAASDATFSAVVRCVTAEAAENLADPKKALGAALDLNDHKISKMDSKRFAAQLAKTASQLTTIGRLVRLVPLLSLTGQWLTDAIDAVADNGKTRVRVSVVGRPSPQAAVPAPVPQPRAPPSGGGGAPRGGAPGAAPTEREVVVYNKVTNGPTQMREDVPAYLSTVPRNYCKRDGCALPGTDMVTGHRIVAICQTTGARTTNGWDANPSDDSNPGLFESTRWYLMRWPDGRTGYLSEVWVAPEHRGGLGLRTC